MLLWIAHNWGWIVGAVVLTAYFGLYVMAVGHARDPQAKDAPGRYRLPCDRC